MPKEDIDTPDKIEEETEEQIKEEKEKENEKDKLEVKYPKVKEKVGWGWGWLVLLGFYTVVMLKLELHPISDIAHGIIYLIQLFGFIFLLFLYFWVRKIIIRKQKYEEIWEASSFAGFISCIIGAFLIVGPLVIVSRLDTKYYLKQFGDLAIEVRERFLQFNQKESNLWDAFIEGPESESEIEHNLKILNDLLLLSDGRITAINEYFEGFKVIVEIVRDESLSEDYNRFQMDMFEFFETYNKGIKSVIEYYKTGDENKLRNGEKTLEEAALLQQEVSKSIFNFIKKSRNIIDDK